MRTLLFIALLVGSVAQAKPNKQKIGEQIGGAIAGIILDEIGHQIDKKINKGKKKHHNKYTPYDKEGEAILNDKGDRIVLGRAFLENYHERDVIHLPRCRFSDNRRVNRIQLRVRRAPAAIDRVVIVYQNGDRQRLRVREYFENGDNTRWVKLDGGRRGRCIKKIRIVGESLANGPRRSVIRVIGVRRGNNGGWN